VIGIYSAFSRSSFGVHGHAWFAAADVLIPAASPVPTAIVIIILFWCYHRVPTRCKGSIVEHLATFQCYFHTLACALTHYTRKGEPIWKQSGVQCGIVFLTQEKVSGQPAGLQVKQ
jgi:hypothetical protein